MNEDKAVASRAHEVLERASDYAEAWHIYSDEATNSLTTIRKKDEAYEALCAAAFRLARHETKWPNRDMCTLRDVMLIGPDGEPLTIASGLSTTLNQFGDTEMRFELRNPEDRSRFGCVVILTALATEDQQSRDSLIPGEPQ